MRALQPARFPNQPRRLNLLEQIPPHPEPAPFSVACSLPRWMRPDTAWPGDTQHLGDLGDGEPLVVGIGTGVDARALAPRA